MSQRLGLVERANEIAREGRCTSVADMQTILIDEGYESVPEKLSDATLNHQLELNVQAALKLNAAGDRLRDLIAKAPEA